MIQGSRIDGKINGICINRTLKLKNLCWNNVTLKNILLLLHIIIIPPSGDVTNVKGHEVNPPL